MKALESSLCDGIFMCHCQRKGPLFLLLQQTVLGDMKCANGHVMMHPSVCTEDKNSDSFPNQDHINNIINQSTEFAAIYYDQKWIDSNKLLLLLLLFLELFTFRWKRKRGSDPKLKALETEEKHERKDLEMLTKKFELITTRCVARKQASPLLRRAN